MHKATFMSQCEWKKIDHAHRRHRRQEPTCSEQSKGTVPRVILKPRENLHVLLLRVSDVLWNT